MDSTSVIGQGNSDEGRENNNSGVQQRKMKRERDDISITTPSRNSESGRENLNSGNQTSNIQEGTVIRQVATPPRVSNSGRKDGFSNNLQKKFHKKDGVNKSDKSFSQQISVTLPRNSASGRHNNDSQNFLAFSQRDSEICNSKDSEICNSKSYREALVNGKNNSGSSSTCEVTVA